LIASMRILFLSNFFPPHDIGGYEQWCYEVASALNLRGHELAVLTGRHGLTTGRAPVSALRGTAALPVMRTLHLESALDYYQPANFFLRRNQQERANLAQLHRTIDRFHPDVVLVWNMWNLSHFLPRHAEQLLPGRVGYFISNYWPTDVDPHTAYWTLPTRRAIMAPLKRPLQAAALARLRREGYPPRLQFRHSVCCSHYVRDTLVAAGKLPDSAGVLVGGTDPAPFLAHSALAGKTPSEVVRLLYFGRLIHDKGAHTALEALDILNTRGLAERVELTILGSGHPDYERRLRRMCGLLGLESKVKFVAQLPREEIPARLGEHDIFLFTSIWPEPMARSVMEAMAAGLLVIGSEVGGQTEMLRHGQNALTFSAEDAATLAGHIAAMIDDPAELRRLARAGQEMVSSRFTLDRMVDDIEQFLVAITTDAQAS
jgi:glycogen synthase